jgi:hypothetical protein
LLGKQNAGMRCFLALSSAKASGTFEITTAISPSISPLSQASIIAWRFVPPPDARTPILALLFIFAAHRTAGTGAAS